MIVAMVALAVTAPLLYLFTAPIWTPDFTMFWAGGRMALTHPSHLYDIDAITALQAPFRNVHAGALPFIYPPSSLWLMIPFALLPMAWGWAAWTAASLLAFWTGVKRVASGWAVWLSFLTPSAVAVLLLGQTSLFIGSAILWSLSLSRERPFLAGVAMGVAAAIKPQCAFLAPIAFVSSRSWAAIAGAFLAWAALAVASLVFGSHLWVDWFYALSRFPAILAHWNLFHYGATPLMAARTLGFGDGALIVTYMIGAATGVAVVWQGARSEDLHTRILTFVCGTLLAAPYAILYELTAAAPVLTTALLSMTSRGLLTALLLYVNQSFLVAPMVAIASIVSLLRGRPDNSDEGEHPRQHRLSEPSSILRL
jgi:hypothetical protein